MNAIIRISDFCCIHKCLIKFKPSVVIHTQTFVTFVVQDSSQSFTSFFFFFEILFQWCNIRTHDKTSFIKARLKINREWWWEGDGQYVKIIVFPCCCFLFQCFLKLTYLRCFLSCYFVFSISSCTGQFRS